jgi:hypothetical protein
LEAYHQRTGVYADGFADYYLNRAVNIYYLGRIAKVVRPTGNGKYEVSEDMQPYSL